LTSQFDLVLVENHCFLEAFYVIIDDLPDKITIAQARETYKDTAHGVIVHKFKKRGQETQQFCHLVYDFKYNKEQAENFIVSLTSVGYRLPLDLGHGPIMKVA